MREGDATQRRIPFASRPVLKEIRELLLRPIIAAAAVAMVLALPLLAVGEVSDNEARAQARAQMFAGGASVADAGARGIQRYFDAYQRDLIAIAAGDIRGAIASREPNALLRGTDRAAAASTGETAQGIQVGTLPASASNAVRVAITDPNGVLLMQEDPRACTASIGLRFTVPQCDAAETARRIHGQIDQRAVELLASDDPSSRSRISRPYVTTIRERSDAAVAIGALITADDSSVTPIGMLLAEISIHDALLSDVAALLDRSEDVYVIDAAGRLVLSARARDVAPLADLTGSALVAKAVRSQPVLSAVKGPLTLREYGGDPFTGAPRPFASSVMTLTHGTRAGDGGRWQVLVVPDQAPVLAVETTLTQLRFARLGFGLALVLGAFLLASAFRAVSRQRAALAEAGRELAAASRHKSEFLANMSHELRTPLNAVIGFADVLEQRMAGELSEKQAEYVRDISTSGKHLLDLVNEILDLSKVEAGRMELEPSEFEVGDTIHGALAFVRERAARHGIELAAEIPADLGKLTADERKIRQVLLNLLSNAVKFTPDGGWIGVTAREEDGEVRISVRDTGVGIALEDHPKVFQEFGQVGAPSERSREGTGLGLALAKRFVELHGGRIWFESEVGDGTTFTFAVPLVHAPQPAGVVR